MNHDILKMDSPISQGDVILEQLPRKSQTQKLKTDSFIGHWYSTSQLSECSTNCSPYFDFKGVGVVSGHKPPILNVNELAHAVLALV